MAGRTIVYEVASDGDVRAEMNGNTLRRALPTQLISTGWTKLRIALRLALQDSGANITGTPRLAIGLCSGTTNPFDNGSGTTTNFIGIVSTAATASRFVVGDSTHYPFTMNVAKRAGTTLTTGTAFTNSAVISAQPATRRNVVIVDIWKGSPNYTLQMFSRNVTTGSDVSKSEIYAQAAILNSVIPNHAWSNGGPSGAGVTLAFTEGAGELNALNVSWDRPSPVLYISDFLVARLE